MTSPFLAQIIRRAVLSEYPRSIVAVECIRGFVDIAAQLPWWQSLTGARRTEAAEDIKSIARRYTGGGLIRVRVLPPSWAVMAGDVALMGSVVVAVVAAVEVVL